MEELAMTGPPAELHGVDKIGAYLGCDPTLLAQALAWQQQWAARGPRKRLGELLLESQLMSGDRLGCTPCPKVGSSAQVCGLCWARDARTRSAL